MTDPHDTPPEGDETGESAEQAAAERGERFPVAVWYLDEVRRIERSLISMRLGEWVLTRFARPGWHLQRLIAHPECDWVLREMIEDPDGAETLTCAIIPIARAGKKDTTEGVITRAEALVEAIEAARVSYRAKIMADETLSDSRREAMLRSRLDDAWIAHVKAVEAAKKAAEAAARAEAEAARKAAEEAAKAKDTEEAAQTEDSNADGENTEESP